MALFFEDDVNFDGVYEVVGGEGDYQHGASGTVYLKKTLEDGGVFKILQLYNRLPLHDGEAWMVRV